MMMLCNFFYIHVYHYNNYYMLQIIIICCNKLCACASARSKVITIPTPLEIDLYISQFVYIASYSNI